MYLDHPPEKWEPTLQLRYVPDNRVGLSPHRLQQCWKLTSGKPEDLNKIEWRDVPTVDVEGRK